MSRIRQQRAASRLSWLLPLALFFHGQAAAQEISAGQIGAFFNPVYVTVAPAFHACFSWLNGAAPSR
jgi:hypothetical protein